MFAFAISHQNKLCVFLRPERIERNIKIHFALVFYCHKHEDWVSHHPSAHTNVCPIITKHKSHFYQIFDLKIPFRLAEN